jgi:hypothetical protein
MGQMRDSTAYPVALLVGSVFAGSAALGIITCIGIVTAVDRVGVSPAVLLFEEGNGPGGGGGKGGEDEDEEGEEENGV